MTNFSRRISIAFLILTCLQGAGCANQRLKEAHEENQTLQEQNDGLKRQLDEVNAELRETKIALERSQADVIATKAAK